MSEVLSTYAELAAYLAPHGLIPRGGFSFSPGEALASETCDLGGTLILVGNAGPAMWDAFTRQEAQGTEPLDEWTRQVLIPIAERMGAEALFPWSEPYHPFQQWAMRAEPVQPSPLGILIHPCHGLWHAYRAAFIFRVPVDLPVATEQPSPCTSCTEKPCLSACPVGAFTHTGYAVEACARHISEPPDRQVCRKSGCLARSACPVGVPYGSEQIRFHMNAFHASRSAT